MAKRAKKRWKAKGRAKPGTQMQTMVLTPRRGRPKRDAGPTPETLAKLRPDVLNTLVRHKVLEPDEASAGREILDAWEIIVADVDARASTLGNRIPGKVHVEGRRAAWLQMVWRTWAPEVLARVGVRPFVVPEWISGERDCAGAHGLLARAIRWWQQAAQQQGSVPSVDTRPQRARLRRWAAPAEAAA